VAAAPVEIQHEIVAAPVEAAPEPVAAEAEPETVAMEPLPDPEAAPIAAEAIEPSYAGDAAQPAHPQFIPVYKEPEPDMASYEVLPTAAPPIGEIEIPRDPELQETADETTRATVADRVEPGLLNTLESLPEAARKPVVDEHPPAWSASDRSNAAVEAAPSAATMEVAPAQTEASPVRAASEVSDADFEARVAAAMAAYSQTTAPVEMHETPVAKPVEVQPEPPAYVAQAAEAMPVEEAPPSFEYRPPVRIAEPVQMAPEASVAPENSAPPVSLVPEHEAPVSASVHEAVTAEVEAAAAAAATESGADHHNIAQAVHRVMERLKPELVEEIMRELKSKK
jgi:hypothetical protein